VHPINESNEEVIDLNDLRLKLALFCGIGLFLFWNVFIGTVMYQLVHLAKEQSVFNAEVKHIITGRPITYHELREQKPEFRGEKHSSNGQKAGTTNPRPSKSVSSGEGG